MHAKPVQVWIRDPTLAMAREVVVHAPIRAHAPVGVVALRCRTRHGHRNAFKVGDMIAEMIKLILYLIIIAISFVFLGVMWIFVVSVPDAMVP